MPPNARPEPARGASLGRPCNEYANDAALHEGPDDLGHVCVVSPEPVDPADNELSAL
jgi:hypothetical protein